MTRYINCNLALIFISVFDCFIKREIERRDKERDEWTNEQTDGQTNRQTDRAREDKVWVV